MNRKTRFLTGLAAAALSFGILYATLGPEHFNRGHRGCHRTENCCGHHEMKNCDNDREFQGQEKGIENKGSIKPDSTKN